MIEQARAIIVAGGWVMYPLIVLSVVGVALCVERAAFWAVTHGRRTKRLLRALHARLHAGEHDAALDLARRDGTVYARLVEGVLERSPEPTEAAALEQIEHLRPTVERFSVILATTIAAAPLLGILGTVTGIIRSFDLLGDSGSVADPTAVAAGIAEALFTTAFGLIVALAILFPYAAFRAQSERCLGRLEALAAAMVQHHPSTPRMSAANPADPRQEGLRAAARQVGSQV